MMTTRPPKTIVKPTALGPVANTDTKLLIYGLFQKGRVLAQDGVSKQELRQWPAEAVRPMQAESDRSGVPRPRRPAFLGPRLPLSPSDPVRPSESRTAVSPPPPPRPACIRHARR